MNLNIPQGSESSWENEISEISWILQEKFPQWEILIEKGIYTDIAGERYVRFYHRPTIWDALNEYICYFGTKWIQDGKSIKESAKVIPFTKRDKIDAPRENILTAPLWEIVSLWDIKIIRSYFKDLTWSLVKNIENKNGKIYFTYEWQPKECSNYMRDRFLEALCWSDKEY